MVNKSKPNAPTRHRDGKTVKPTKTYVAFLLDRTGSMQPIAQDTVGAFNAYLGELKNSGADIDFSLVLFDSMRGMEKVHVNKPIADVPELKQKDYVPSGNTPLIDAAYKTIKAVESSEKIRISKPKVVIAIQTDGEENASHDHTMAQLRDLIQKKTDEGWQFVFMGANIDAYKQAGAFGIGSRSTVSYNANDPTANMAMFASTARNTARFAMGQSATMDYSEEQKTASGDKYAPRPAVKVKTTVEARIEERKKKNEFTL